jgi:hypothetical protein
MTSRLGAKEGSRAPSDTNSTQTGEFRSVPHESGIPPRPYAHKTETDEALQLALAETARAEANLNLLLRGLQSLTAGLTAMQRSHATLRREIERARRCEAEGWPPGVQARALADALALARAEAAEERRLLIEQQDAFLSDLLEEHARQIAVLKETPAQSSESGDGHAGARRATLESASGFSEVDWNELEEFDSARLPAAKLLPRAETVPGLGLPRVPRPDPKPRPESPVPLVRRSRPPLLPESVHPSRPAKRPP